MRSFWRAIANAALARSLSRGRALLLGASPTSWQTDKNLEYHKAIRMTRMLGDAAHAGNGRAHAALTRATKSWFVDARVGLLELAAPIQPHMTAAFSQGLEREDREVSPRPEGAYIYRYTM